MAHTEQVTAAQRAQYIDILTGMFEVLFTLKKAGAERSVEKARAEAFALAGEALGLFKRPRLQQLMAEVHLKIIGTALPMQNSEFGVNYRQALDNDQFEELNIPTLLRQQPLHQDKEKP